MNSEIKMTRRRISMRLDETKVGVYDPKFNQDQDYSLS